MGVPTTAEALIERMTAAKAGDKEAFADVYTSLFVPVYRYILRRVGSRSDAEDLSQTVFMRLYTSASPFTAEGKSPLHYLFTMAHNILVDHWKKHGSAPSQSFDAEMIESADNAHSHKLEDELTIAAALEKLTGDEHVVIQEKFFTGLSTKEIAGHLGKSEVAVRQIQCRALKTLREILAG
ncbi:MAG: sigma-70 family RNA polymerase sigma factor [Candidatus Magasanikbacteria bacterium]|nr:sigma-70 family RNA polymerase sigma factor [Candidatus Magasanikbacteria bacterium]